MVDREESRLKEMKLTKLIGKDIFLSQDDDWPERNNLHRDLKNSSYIAKKPTGNYFEFEENTVDKDYITCHLMIPVVMSKVTPMVPHSDYLESDESEEIESEESEEVVEEMDTHDLGIEDNPHLKNSQQP